MHQFYICVYRCGTNIENRIYIRGEFGESLGMNFFNPFPPESSKCTNHVNVHKLYAVEYIRNVNFLLYSVQWTVYTVQLFYTKNDQKQNKCFILRLKQKELSSSLTYFEKLSTK